MAALNPGRDTTFEPVRTTSDERVGELFGVHIPELQLPIGEYRAGCAAADLRPDERYLELGSGHGIGLVVAAREFGAHAMGVEYLDDAIARARTAAARAGVADRVEIVQADLRRIDPTSADVVHLHLGPAFHDVLASRLEALLTPRARVIAAGWRVPGWRALPDSAERWDGGYVYRPADPRMHLTWHDAIIERGRVLIVDATVHADLEALELRVDAASASAPAAISTSVARRGQRISIAVARTPEPAELTLWARSRNGRLTQRGPALALQMDAMR